MPSDPRYILEHFPAWTIPCDKFVSFGAVHRTDDRLIKEHTSLDLALYYCQRPKFHPFTEFVFFNEPSAEIALKKLLMVLHARMSEEWRVTANDRWTAFYHFSTGETGRTTVIACRDKVDAAMFRMEWPSDHS